MRPISIEKLNIGDVIAKNVLDSYGNVLLTEGTTVKSRTIVSRLQKLGICSIYIQDSWSADIFIEPVIDEELAKKTMDVLTSLDIEQVHKAASEIVDKLISTGRMYDDMQTLKVYDEYTFTHSLNVAVLSATLGIGLGLSYERLRNLTEGAILHDIGKQAIPISILNKKGPLTDEEMAIVKKHPEEGYRLLKGDVEITSSVRGIIHEHHENWDGSGYPFGNRGEEIYDLAHVVHICDVWDALLSKRSYKEAFSIKDTIALIMKGSGTQFNVELVDAFFKYVPVYSKGSEVTLSNGENVLIYENNRKNMLRPIVLTKDKKIINLEESDLEIVS